jgi:hypothetical protein
MHCIDTANVSNDTDDMKPTVKTAQLQIRVSETEKRAIQRAAKDARMDMSAYVLSLVLSANNRRFDALVTAVADAATPRFALAELNSLLSGLKGSAFRDAIAQSPTASLSPFIANYVAAMVEMGCAERNLPVPPWTQTIGALPEPWFGTELVSLRLYLLTHSPAAFRSRNLFIDSTLGARV